jgi:hypothetical protein
MNRKLRGLMYTIPGFAIGVVAATSCSGKDALGGLANDLAAQCGLVCPGDGEHIADGNASISGVASVDAFFSSVVRFQTTADAISGGIQAELDAIAASVGAKAGDNADLKLKLKAQFDANISGGLKVTYQPPQCTVSAKATLEAQAKCDASIKPGMASVKCEGSCTADAGVKVDCGASATLKCTGTAPMLTCMGECKGDCQLDAAASCSGTCNGTCSGTCTVKDAAGNCAGSCMGMCKGTCKLEAAASCSGSCKGECTYTPPSGMCDASAQAHCDAMANAEVECKGSCSGKVTPPMAKAECEASAKADASISADCKPPSLNVSYQFNAMIMGDATGMGAAKFQAWLEGFKGHVSAILAYRAKLDGLATVGTDLAGSAQGAIEGSINATLKGKLDLKASIGLKCALDEVPGAIKLVKDSGTKLQASAQGSLDVLGSIGVS